MGGLECLRDLAGEPESFAERNRASGDAVLERLARDELQGEEVRALDLFEAVDRRDARMIERREDVGLAREPRQAFGVAREGLGEDLEGDLALEARVACAPDFAHASGPERAENLVRPEARSGFDAHGGWR